jgi:hypothetical protein
MVVTPAGAAMGVMDVMGVTVVVGATDVMGATDAKLADVIQCRPVTAKGHVKVKLERAVTVPRPRARLGKA